jgi:hypothetical protein
LRSAGRLFGHREFRSFAAEGALGAVTVPEVVDIDTSAVHPDEVDSAAALDEQVDGLAAFVLAAVRGRVVEFLDRIRALAVVVGIAVP